MIDDMRARRFSEDTQKDYVRNVRNFAAFLGRSPDTATKEDLRRFQLHMAQQQISPGSINAAIAALRFFFTVTLERPDLVRPLRLVTDRAALSAAGTCRARNIERVRQALAASEGAPQRSRAEAGGEAEDVAPARRCPCWAAG